MGTWSPGATAAGWARSLGQNQTGEYVANPDDDAGTATVRALDLGLLIRLLDVVTR